MRARLSMVVSTLTMITWAVPVLGAAHFIAQTPTTQTRTPVAETRTARFRIEEERGLLISAWLNGAGPYIFVVDTGAGQNVITDRLVSQARLSTRNISPTVVGGLTTARTSSSREAIISRMALGDSANLLAAAQTALVVSYLPPDIDGILDPTEAYSPFGYSIDMVNKQIDPVDTNASSSRNRSTGAERASVSWIRMAGSNRPFVRLGDGRLALIDTGSAFGLAVNERHAVIVGTSAGRHDPLSRDIGGGTISSRRVSPTTISIGSLVLRGIPTDILFGVEDNAPLILGRDALYPFKITFDPGKRQIEFVASRETE